MNILEGWLNTDIHPLRDVIRVNVLRRLPFPDQSIDRIFSEHMFEHLDYPNGVALCNEMFRVLKPGGRIRMSMPDLAFLIDLYRVEKRPEQLRYIEAARENLAARAPVNDTGVINNFFRDWGHEFIYDFKTVRDVLMASGFAGIKRCPIGKSDDPLLTGLEHHGRVIGEESNELESMVVEADKPGRARGN